MIWLIGLLIFNLFWLIMTRVCIRWTIELGYRDDCPWPRLIWCSLLKWPKGLIKMLPSYLEHDHHALQFTYTLLGESRWHRDQRLEEEHRKRCEDLGVPAS